MASLAHARIYSLGSVNLDLQVRAERWPEPGETLLTEDLLRTSGGKAANRALLARRLGAASTLLACVGADDFALEVLQPLRDAGVDLDSVATAPAQATGLSMIVVRPDGDKTILLSPNANMDWSPADGEAVSAVLASAPVGSVLTVDLEVPELVVRAAVRAARERALTVVLDPSPAQRMPSDLYPSLDCLTPNPGEAQTLCGFPVDSREQALQAAEHLVQRGVRTACVKLGSGGCAVVTENERFFVAAPAAEVVDKTGAGDGFAGALGVALLENKPLGDAVRSAVFAASLTVTRYGSQAAYPDRERLELALAQGRLAS